MTTERVTAELIAHAPQGVAPGRPVWLGLKIAHKPGWHTYWKNAGDSGLPTDLQWRLPAGLDPGEIAWPAPKKIAIGHLANYGYEGTVLLPVPVAVATNFKPPLAGLFGGVDVKLHARWLVCKEECIPEEGDFALTLPAAGSTAMDGGAFEAAFAAAPRPLATRAVARIEDGLLRIEAALPPALAGRRLEAFFETPDIVRTAAAGTQSWSGTAWRLDMPLAEHRRTAPTLLPVVLAAADAFRVEAEMRGAWPPIAATAGVSPGLQAALAQNAAAGGGARPASAVPLTFWAALVGALIGGLVLNLMPCVLPVLAIKVAGFAGAGQDTRRRRVGALAYAAGVVASFLALAGALLALRAGGEELGWGFQLQSPAVVAALAALFTLIALNLAGVFEFGRLLPSRLLALEAKHPVADEALSGVLAVAIASPCTAPFMGASLGYAVGVPPAQALAIFAALGVGMALPYVLAALSPGLARRLPAPGAWMVTFRRAMAFPMFATVAWLVWVLGRQTGVDGAGALLAMLVALGMLAWALSLRGVGRAAAATVAIAALVGLWTTLGPQTFSESRAADVAASNGAQAASADGWQPWEPGRTEQLVAEGRTVLVDFTAAWCITCQYNKQAVLSKPEVVDHFRARNVALLRADWTRRDPAITAALSQLGRSGVPVYAIFRPGRPTQVLTEILSVRELRAAL